MVCLLAVAGCDSGITGDRGNARQGGSVLVGLAQPPDSLDPALAASPEALQALWLAYTPPMTYRRAEGAKGTQIVPGLAQSEAEPLDESSAFRFTLRPDLAYSDGRPVRAADVERAIRRSRALNPAARRAFSGNRGGRRERARAHSAHPPERARPRVPAPAGNPVDRAGAAGNAHPRHVAESGGGDRALPARGALPRAARTC